MDEPLPTDPELALLARLRADALVLVATYPESPAAKNILAIIDRAEREYRATPEQAECASRLLRQLGVPPEEAHRDA
jgi:hypothetical protein